MTSKLSRLPPTARFFTGGDRSVRGYDYLELGPTDPAGNVTVVLDSSDALSKVFYRAGFISSETVRLGIALPLHPLPSSISPRRELRCEAISWNKRL